MKAWALGVPVSLSARHAKCRWSPLSSAECYCNFYSLLAWQVGNGCPLPTCVFETGSLTVALGVLELALSTKLTSKSHRNLPAFLTAGIGDAYQHAGHKTNKRKGNIDAGIPGWPYHTQLRMT